jgi:hypothetical protein
MAPRPQDPVDDPFVGTRPIGAPRLYLAGLVLLVVPLYVLKTWPVPARPTAARVATEEPSPSLFLTPSGESRSEPRLAENRDFPSPRASVRVPVAWPARPDAAGTPLAFSFDRGVGFHVTANGCDGAESRTDGVACWIEVRFAPGSSGTYRDRLVVRKGDAFATLALTGEGNGWSEGWLEWDGKPSRRTQDGWFVAGPGTSGAVTRDLVARNNGAGPVAPGPDDLFDPPKPGTENPWQVLGGTCLTDFVKPGATCTVRLSFRPGHDGAFSRRLRFPRMPGSRRPDMRVVGFARGVAGVLPPDVRGVGDRCPLPGESAEVTVPESYGYADWNGDFIDRGAGAGEARQAVVTQRCESWSDAGQGDIRCEGGSGANTVRSLTEYRSRTIAGPWSVYSRNRLGGGGIVSCVDGRISAEPR